MKLIAILTLLACSAVASPIDPVFEVQKVLEDTNIVVACKTNDALVFCTIRCRDLDQRNAFYDKFSEVKKYALTATKDPPTVCIVLVYDPARFGAQQYSAAMGANLKNAETIIVGKVIQSTSDGLLVSESSGRTVFVVDGPDLIDDEHINVRAFWIGRYQYTSVNNSMKTVDKFTCDREAAVAFWKRPSEAKSKTELMRRSGQYNPDSATKTPEPVPSSQPPGNAGK